MKRDKLIWVPFFMFMLALGLWGCSPAVQTVTETVVVTVEKTVPVEVTRLVPVQQTVEVTRQVQVTQLVEVPVTTTPAPTASLDASQPAPATQSAPATQAAPADQAGNSTSQDIVYPTMAPSPTFPEQKTEGFAPLKMVNETNDSLMLNIDGPFQQTYSLPGKQTLIKTVKEGQYDYTVTREGKIIFRGTMKITNPDKHEIHIRADKVVFLVP